MSNKMSRPKPPPPGTEEASATLNLGEFQNVDTLTFSEASLVLNALVSKRRNDRKNVNETEYAPTKKKESESGSGNDSDSDSESDSESEELDEPEIPSAGETQNSGDEDEKSSLADVPLSRMLNQTLNYLDHFARFTQKENVEAVERLLSSHKDLAKFERAQLGSLCCENADEAKTLIPSLAEKIKDEDLQELLDEISKLQNR